jgi:hypothetical protein
MTQKDRGLIIEIRNLAKAERALTSQLLEKIALVHKSRLYADLGHSSLLAWRMGDLHYSKSAAIHQTEIETKTRISLARREELISKIKNKSSDETDRLIAIEFPDLRPRPPETVRAVGLEESELKIVLNKEQMAILNRVKEVTSHSHFNTSTAELIEVMGRFFLQHKDPLKAKLRESTKLALNKSLSTGAAAEPNSGLDQTIGVVRESTFHESNVCSPRHQFRHGEQSEDLGENLSFREQRKEYSPEKIKLDARAREGIDHPENLRPLCRTHNRLAWKIESKRTD